MPRLPTQTTFTDTKTKTTSRLPQMTERLSQMDETISSINTTSNVTGDIKFETSNKQTKHYNSQGITSSGKQINSSRNHGGKQKQASGSLTSTPSKLKTTR